VTWLEENGLLTGTHRVAHEDFVGNYLILRYGQQRRVFIDDRYDMYPVSLATEYRTLLQGRTGALDILERRQIDVVLWEKDLPLVQILRAAGWRETFRERDYVVLQP